MIYINYRYFENTNFEHFSSGSVIQNEAGFTNYPVRLACEIFMRCINFAGKQKVSLYDPCCGSGYLLTVIGFLCGSHIQTIYASDISDSAVQLAKKNLELLTKQGLIKRKEHIQRMYNDYGKQSHEEAIKSAENLMAYVDDTIERYVFASDILQADNNRPTNAVDIVIVDVPYGCMVSWSEPQQAINNMLCNISGCLSDNAVVAVSSDKSQKISNSNYKRLEKFQVGKRKIEILHYL